MINFQKLKKGVSNLLKTSVQFERYKMIKESFSDFRDKVPCKVGEGAFLSIFLDTDVQIWPLFRDPKSIFQNYQTPKTMLQKCGP